MDTIMERPAIRYDAKAMEDFAARLFVAAGLEASKAEDVAWSLVEADCIGHATHGLAIAPWYVEDMLGGGMTLSGDVEVIRDHGACIAWKGRRLPGAWLINRAIDRALARIADHGVVTVTIAEGHHTGALAAYLSRITERGLMAILTCSGPAAQGVAPYGGKVGVFTPNPLSSGIPTHSDPILLDISCSVTTIKRSTQLAKAGGCFPSPWVLDHEGNPTNDPAALIDRGGTLLPVGGLDHGHKGYATALLVEALTQGLCGTGRRDRLSGTVMNTFLQVIDPEAFGGRTNYLDETTWLVDACHASSPRPGVERVRVPGDQAAERRAASKVSGVALAPAIVEALVPLGRRLGIECPPPLER